MMIVMHSAYSKIRVLSADDADSFNNEKGLACLESTAFYLRATDLVVSKCRLTLADVGDVFTAAHLLSLDSPEAAPKVIVGTSRAASYHLAVVDFINRLNLWLCDELQNESGETLDAVCGGFFPRHFPFEKIWGVFERTYSDSNIQRELNRKDELLSELDREYGHVIELRENPQLMDYLEFKTSTGNSEYTTIAKTKLAELIDRSLRTVAHRISKKAIPVHPDDKSPPRKFQPDVRVLTEWLESVRKPND